MELSSSTENEDFELPPAAQTRIPSPPFCVSKNAEPPPGVALSFSGTSPTAQATTTRNTTAGSNSGDDELQATRAMARTLDQKDKDAKRPARKPRRQRKQSTAAVALQPGPAKYPDNGSRAATVRGLGKNRPKRTTAGGASSVSSTNPPFPHRGLAKNRPKKKTSAISSAGHKIAVIPSADCSQSHEWEELQSPGRDRDVDEEAAIDAEEDPQQCSMAVDAKQRLPASPYDSVPGAFPGDKDDYESASVADGPPGEGQQSNTQEGGLLEEEESISLSNNSMENDDDNLFPGDISRRNEYLVLARLVSDKSSAVIEATPVDDKSNFFQSRTCYVVLACVCMVMVGVAVAITVVLRAVETTLSPTTTTPTVSPSFAPTAFPTSSPTHISQTEGAAALLRQLNATNLTITTVADDYEGTSPPSKALAWLLLDPSLELMPDQEKLQRFVLATLFYSTEGEQWENSDNWMGYRSNECIWWMTEGFDACNSDNDLTGLSVTNNQLNGTLPLEVSLLANTLSALDISRNGLTGTVPVDWGALTQLRHLNISHNQISASNATSSNGSLVFWPPELSKLENLKEMDASFNNISAPFPALLLAQKGLHELNLQSNRFWGTIPKEITRGLTHLDISSNALEGPLPTEMGRLTNLCHLDLSRNNISGTLPSQLGLLWPLDCGSQDVRSLVGSDPVAPAQLNLSQNSLSGPIPAELFGPASFLQIFDMGGNSFTGTLSTTLWLTPELRSFNVSGNLLSGVISSDLGTSGLGLSTLDLSRNNISGSLPTELGLLRTLCDLDVSSNSIGGTIPTELGKLCRLYSSEEIDFPFALRFGFFDGTTRFLFSDEELDGLLYETKRFFTDLFQATYPNFRYLNIPRSDSGFELELVGLGSDVPVRLNLPAKLSFSPGTWLSKSLAYKPSFGPSEAPTSRPFSLL